nr:MAG TPA: hypothetical protein [Caudoviricetes sp.]
MKIGDILSIEPTLEATSGLGTIGPIPARVIYIHPAGRYYTVEFRSPITGYNWREAFWPKLALHTEPRREEPHFDYTKKLKT